MRPLLKAMARHLGTKPIVKTVARRLATDPRYTPFYNRLKWWFRGQDYSDREISPCYQAMYHELAQLCLQARPVRLLEFGCGDAHLLRQISSNGCGIQLFGCDFSSTQLEGARSLLPEAKFELQDIRSTTYGNKAFSVAIGVSVLMYLSPRGLAEALAELRRISEIVISVEMDCRYLGKEKVEAFRNAADGRFDHDYPKAFDDTGFQTVESRRIEAFWDPQLNTLGEMGYGIIVATD